MDPNNSSIVFGMTNNVEKRYHHGATQHPAQKASTNVYAVEMNVEMIDFNNNDNQKSSSSAKRKTNEPEVEPYGNKKVKGVNGNAVVGAIQEHSHASIVPFAENTSSSFVTKPATGTSVVIKDCELEAGMRKLAVEIRSMIWNDVFEFYAESGQLIQGRTPKIVKETRGHLFYHEIVRIWYEVSFVRVGFRRGVNSYTLKDMGVPALMEIRKLVIDIQVKVLDKSIPYLERYKAWPDPREQSNLKILHAINIKELILDCRKFQRAPKTRYDDVFGAWLQHFKRVRRVTIMWQQKSWLLGNSGPRLDQGRVNVSFRGIENHLGKATEGGPSDDRAVWEVKGGCRKFLEWKPLS